MPTKQYTPTGEPNHAEKTERLQELIETITEEVTQETRFVQRTSKLNGVGFVKLMVLGNNLERSQASLNDLSQVSRDLGISITGPGINQRIHQEAVALLEGVFARTLQHLSPSDSERAAILDRFPQVHIVDSTQVSLPEALQEYYAGSGGSASSSQMKIHLAYEYRSGLFEAIEMTAGKCPDQNSDLPERLATAGSLALFDLGYFKIQRLAMLHANQAYFVSRFQTQTGLYFQENALTKIDLLSTLKKLPCQEGEFNAYLGSKQRIPVRIIYQQVPEEVAAERRRKSRRALGKKGKIPSKLHLALLGWTIFITNVAPEILSTQQVRVVYGVRWQAEIVFKVWKSNAGLAHIGHWRIERLLCQLYARLIVLVVFQWLAAPYRFCDQSELSLSRAFRVFQRYALRIIDAIADGWVSMPLILRNIETDFLSFACMTHRIKHPSTYRSLSIIGL
jgi:hypothetical protein